MQMSREEVAHVAWLARLALSEAELERYAGQLSGILSHIVQLQELDVTDIAPTAMAVEAGGNVVRADVPTASAPQDEVLANAADIEDGSFRVRAILEESA
ncbi:MAG: Asp-tRNA(Asn)/Glu-tRNA(Gln) amidotransferase subunit GatC [Fimbriimonadaceae bacterium]|nr:Asp-tRNA(Asn)/Glu-tRNA(Gln) amidotransferase subunit GatC [Fimbriimonadaceae bacterium]